MASHTNNNGHAERKPKLVFFQFKYDRHLPPFLLTHKQEHVQCLSQFFDVTLINEDCDYQQICDQYQPDLALFESGVNHGTCHRLQIENVRSNPQVPKIALHHADAFCNARAGFLSDMDHWGIETFFAIATTAAEHTPEIAKNLFVWPVFIDDSIYRDYGIWKTVPVLFTGNKNQLYPWRQSVARRVVEHYPSLICPHPGYNPRSAALHMLIGEEYARTLNASWFVPACGTVAKEVVRKHFEVPASKACLVTERSAGLESAGFIDMTNCVFADEHDVLDKLDHLFHNRDLLTRVIEEGHQLVHSRHTIKQRDQIYQWYKLHKTLQPEQRIIQTGPFQPLAIVDAAEARETYHVHSQGLHLSLLRQGDSLLSEGKYDEAEGKYLKCAAYMPWMPEPKLKLALCRLYKGDAKKALSWLEEPLRFSLCVYQAVDPDPVEWAYFIVSCLCAGKLEEAAKHASEYAWLRHPELDRARWAVGALKGSGSAAPAPSDDSVKRRPSMHQLPVRDMEGWTAQLCTMLKACGQSAMAATITNQLSVKAPKEIGNAVAPVTKTAPPRFKKQQLTSRLTAAAKDPVKSMLHGLEGKFGYFLPYELSTSKNDECFQAIQKLAGEANVASMLVIGAGLKKHSTEAALAGFLPGKRTLSAFCIADASQRAGVNNGAAAKWHKLSRSANAGAELVEAIERFKSDNGIDGFDLVLVSHCDLGDRVNVIDILDAELAKANTIVLEDISTAGSHRNYHGLLRNPLFRLADSNPALRDGYAIFQKKGIGDGSLDQDYSSADSIFDTSTTGIA